MSAAKTGPRVIRDDAKERAALAAAYREGLGLAAITVMHGPAGIHIAGGEAGAAGVSAAAIDARWWCHNAADARRVAVAATARLQRRDRQDAAAATPAAVGDAATAIVAAARRLNVGLYTDDDVADEAARIIARVDEQIETLKRAGDMKSINRSYKNYRIEASARGDKVLPYAQWLNKYRHNLLRELATVFRYR